jgi:hypothetical protein
MTMTSPYNDGGFRPWTPAWPELDASLLEDARGAVPAFPLDVLPGEWRQWVEDTAQSAGTPVDYVAQGVFAAVAALSGAGVRIRVTPAWSESLVLWLALVGSPSSGKSPALASVREQVAQIEETVREDDGRRRGLHAAKLADARLALDRWNDECESAANQGMPAPMRPAEADFDRPFVPSQIVVADATMEALADVVAGNPRGVILWRDELTAWLANLNRYANGGSDRAHWLEAWAAAGITVNRRSRTTPLHLPKFPVSVVGSIQPDRLAEAFQGSDDGMAARFLYAWPEMPKYTSLMDRRIPRDDSALAMLQNIALVANPDQPLTMTFDSHALGYFDELLQRMHDEAEAAGGDGLMAGWLGKGRGTVARLAGALTLLQWSENGAQDAPRGIARPAVEAAADLWRRYFRPHAETVFGQAGKADRDRHARKVVRWLKATKPVDVSATTLRREALLQTLDATETDRVIARLEEAGFLRPVPVTVGPKGGRPARRWQVNPAVRM